MTDKKLTFEQSLTRLSEISALMNDTELPLEESLKLYGEAVGLIDICKRRIETARLTIEKIENQKGTEDSRNGNGQ
ncbi:MAG: exodeoxyribonuclease VII small subunit [Oscillospiraceae bacterium]|nr:exodeoxyribonuclease VII small subunit [Oscillospiraceae bacterium]